MPPEIYVITGATGHIGRRISEILVSQGQKVRVIGRNMEKLKTLGGRRVEIFQGNMEDQGTMTRAFTGVKAVFTMIPPNYKSENFRMYQNRMSQVYQASIIGAGVEYVINLSSIGAQNAEGGGPINGLYDHEQRFNRLDAVNVLHLRPTYFMENHVIAMEMVRKTGMYGSPLKRDLKLPMIATRDVAAEAAERFLKMDFKGKSFKELLGPREYTLQEVTTTIAPLIERPDLQYVQFPYEQAEQAMITMGMSKDVASLMVQMQKSMNEGRFKPVEPRNPKNTTPTQFEALAKELFHPLKVARGKAAKKK